MAKQTPPLQTWKYTGLCRLMPLIAAAVYTLSAYLSSPLLNVSHMRELSFFVLQLTLVLPLALIWWIAMRGAIHLKLYADTIRKTPDGEGIQDIANGLLLLVFYVISLPLLRTIAILFSDSRWFSTALAIDNLLPVLLMVASVSYLFVGSRKLGAVVESRLWTPKRVRMAMIIFGILAALFTSYFCLVVPGLDGDNGIPRFMLPVPLLAFIYAVPQLVVWLLGCVACLNISYYAVRTPGHIYKVLFMRLNTGIVLVIGCIFASQLLILSPVSLSGFTPASLLIYVGLIVTTFGFVGIARGADGLRKVEEVQ